MTHGRCPIPGRLDRRDQGTLKLRLARRDDAAMLREWDDEPHVVASDPNDDWNWEDELGRVLFWREQWVAEVADLPIGFLQIIDPAHEESKYWGHDVQPGKRAIDIWIGPAQWLGRGYGTQMMILAIDRCFAVAGVDEIWVDPLAANSRAIQFYRRLGFEFVEERQFGEDFCSVHSLKKARWQV